MTKQEIANIIQSGAGTYTTVSGTDTYTATLAPVPAGYTTGMSVRLNFANANTTAATININSLGAKGLKKQGGAALVSGDIVAGTIYTATYDGTNFQMDVGTIGDWVDYVPTITGFSVNPTILAARYTLIGKTCIVYVRMSTGTSNATTFTLTLPYTAANTNNQYGFGAAHNNGVTQTTAGMIVTRANSNIADLYINASSAAWTASGNKLFNFGSFTYEIL